MTEGAQRLEHLFDELRYAITLGLMNEEITENLHFTFVVPVSRQYPQHGVVACTFEMKALEHFGLASELMHDPPLSEQVDDALAAEQAEQETPKPRASRVIHSSRYEPPTYSDERREEPEDE